MKLDIRAIPQLYRAMEIDSDKLLDLHKHLQRGGRDDKTTISRVIGKVYAAIPAYMEALGNEWPDLYDGENQPSTKRHVQPLKKADPKGNSVSDEAQLPHMLVHKDGTSSKLKLFKRTKRAVLFELLTDD